MGLYTSLSDLRSPGKPMKSLKFRGKNIGSLLVDQAVKRCEELGCYKVLLYCYDDVVSFYERNGFEVFKQNLMGKTLGK